MAYDPLARFTHDRGPAIDLARGFRSAVDAQGRGERGASAKTRAVTLLSAELIRQELVDEERWISSAHFNRVLAVCQVLPGPEAHELCVYFGMRSRGRWGGVLADSAS